MRKDKKRHGPPRSPSQQHTPGRSSPATAASTPNDHTRINRTHTKLPKKRKKQRQELIASTIPPSDQYEIVISGSSTPPWRRDMNRGGFRGRRGGANHGGRGRGIGMFSLSKVDMRLHNA
jgi:hypothetical protein